MKINIILDENYSDDISCYQHCEGKRWRYDFFFLRNAEYMPFYELTGLVFTNSL